MGSVTVSVPDDMKRKMDELAVINWSAVARKAFDEQLGQLELVEAIVSKSKATEKDAEELAAKVKRSVWKKHGARN